MFHIHPSCICFQWQPRKCEPSISLTSGTLPSEVGGHFEQYGPPLEDTQMNVSS